MTFHSLLPACLQQHLHALFPPLPNLSTSLGIVEQNNRVPRLLRHGQTRTQTEGLLQLATSTRAKRPRLQEPHQNHRYAIIAGVREPNIPNFPIQSTSCHLSAFRSFISLLQKPKRFSSFYSPFPSLAVLAADLFQSRLKLAISDPTVRTQPNKGIGRRHLFLVLSIQAAAANIGIGICQTDFLPFYCTKNATSPIPFFWPLPKMPSLCFL